MTTSTSPPAVAYQPDTLAAQLRGRSHHVIEQELERLARKAPALTEQELNVVTEGLHELVERTFVGRAKGPAHREAQLRHLFGLPDSA